MFRLSRNERSHWSGNGVHVEPESVFMIGRNMHLFLYGLPMGMEITVDIEKEKVLFITLKDKESYRVHLQSLSVVEMIKAHSNLKLAAKAGGKDPHQEAQEFFALQKKKEPVRI